MHQVLQGYLARSFKVVISTTCQIWSAARNGGQHTGSSCRKCEYHFVDSVALPLTIFLSKGSQLEVNGPAQGDSESLSVPPSPVIRAETPLAIDPLEQLDLADPGCLDDTRAEVRDGQHSEPRVHTGSDDADPDLEELFENTC